MVSLASSAAVLLITQLLFISAWLSARQNPWLHYLWAAIIVLLWAQPWSRSDPYRTNKLIVRLGTYVLIILMSLASWYVYDRTPILLVGLLALVLGLIEYRGQAALKSARP